ncbi:intermembrane phospholipid transport protein YdbH family protein [Henriciella sp.]|uniref:intermembrane phospholipid transport protein YdbH family protein n=1 Tax=Henriciella sp. TaxID=1968823 RepID=UPI003C72D1FC
MLLLLIGGLLAAWLLRIQIADYAVQKWCTSQSLTCEADITELGLSGAAVSDLSIRTQAGETPLEAREAQLDLVWPGLFQPPQVKSIRVTSPVLRGRYGGEDGSTSFGGLEQLGGGESTGPSPEFEVQDARVELDTPAGPLVILGRARGQMPMLLDFEAEIEPVELESEGNRLVIREGHINVSLIGIKLDGDAEFDLEQAEFDDLSATNIKISAAMAEGLRPVLNWTAKADTFSRPGLSVEAAEIEGSVSLRGNTDDEASWIDTIGSATIEASAQTAVWKESSAGESELTLDVQRTKSGELDASYGLVVRDVARPDVTAESATLSGQASLERDLSAGETEGDLSFEALSVPEPYRTQILTNLNIGGPFERHSSSLRAGLSAALEGMQGGTGFSGKLSEGGYWSLVSTRALSVESANGTALSLVPAAGRPALNIADEAVELEGLLTLDGPGLPETSIDLKRARIDDTSLSVETGGVEIAPWTAGGLTLSAELNELLLQRSDGIPRLKTVGEIAFDGSLYGLQLADTRLFGGIDAAGGASLRVQTYNTNCLGLDSEGIATGGYAVDPVSLQLCPRDGRVVRPISGGSAGTIDLGAADVPFRSENASGTLSLDNAVLDWSATKTARIDLKGSRMSLPMSIGEKTLSLTSTDPEIHLQTTSPVSLRASTGVTEFDGTLVPAEIALDSLSLDATLPASGLRGVAEAKQVTVRDRGDDPLYVPLIGDLSAEFQEGVMLLTGPVTTRAAGRKIADITLNLDLLSLDGTASVSTPDLTFEPRRFQPTALSERVRGFLSNARGTLRGGANFDIASGKTSGTGWVAVENFGFDTLRLGAVNDVNGRIDFTDIMTLTTGPGQEIRLGEINPGIELNDGVIRFQLTNGTEATIEDARWPFAGGELYTGGSTWSVAGTRDVIEISAQALELTDIVKAFSLPDIKANGTVSGAFPVEIVGPNAYIRNASLTADSEGGTLAYTGEVADAAAEADERVSLAFEALKDFRFSVLELGADGNLSGDMLITLRLVGKSPEVLDGAPFAFNIGIDSKLMQLIRTGRSLTTSDWLADVTAQSAKARAEAAAAEAPSE